MKEDVSDINDNKNKNIYKEKEAECIDNTFPDEIQEGIYDRNNNKNEKYDEGKNEDETTDYNSTTLDEGKGVMK